MRIGPYTMDYLNRKQLARQVSVCDNDIASVKILIRRGNTLLLYVYELSEPTRLPSPSYGFRRSVDRVKSIALLSSHSFSFSFSKFLSSKTQEMAKSDGEGRKAGRVHLVKSTRTETNDLARERGEFRQVGTRGERWRDRGQKT